MGLSVDAERRPARAQRHRRRGRATRRRPPCCGASRSRVRRSPRASTDDEGGRGAVRRPPARLPGPGTARAAAHRGRLRAQGRGAGDAGPRRGRRRAARRADRQHRARRRRQPAPADQHPARRRGRAGARAGRLPRHHRRRAWRSAAPSAGEHGVGLLKRDGLAQELSPEVVAMQRAVKAALDPHGILNPGKVCSHARRWAGPLCARCGRFARVVPRVERPQPRVTAEGATLCITTRRQRLAGRLGGQTARGRIDEHGRLPETDGTR